MPLSLRSVVPVWIAAVVGAVLVGVVAASAYLVWIPVVLALCVLLTFALQLALRRKDGLVTRTTASVVGAVLVLAAATAVLAVVDAAGV